MSYARATRVAEEAPEGMVWLLIAQGQAERSARLGGASKALRETLGMALHPVLHPGHEQTLQAMRAA